MAKNDILPYVGTDQGTVLPAPEWGSLTAAQSFVTGEPVLVVAAGTVSEAATNPSTIDGIAAASGDTVGATDANGTFRIPNGLFTPGASPNLPVAGDPVPFWRVRQRRKWIAARFSTDGTGAALTTPALSHIGDTVGLALNSGNWSVDNAVANKVGKITDVIDAGGESITRSGKTGANVIFEFTIA